MDNKENKKGGELFKSFVSKTTDLGKKVADGIQKGAENISEQNKQRSAERKIENEKKIYKKKIEKYRPVFAKDFNSKKFDIPNVIQIVDDATRNGIDVCEGAIGYKKTVKGVEIFCLYDNWVEESKIVFVPFWACDVVYCKDPCDKMCFIKADDVFGRWTNEKIAELEHIASCLGAKSFSVEIVEENRESAVKRMNLNLNMQAKQTKEEANISQSVSHESSRGTSNKYSGKNTTHFEGHHDPKPPTLKWFATDGSIKGLVDNCCSGNNSIKSKVLELKGSTASTMSQKNAAAIDEILHLKGNASLEKEYLKEHSKKFIFEIEF